jgi:hypothetical protein
MDFPVLGGPIGATHCLYLHEYGWTDNGVPRAPLGSVYAESGNIVLGEGDRRYHVRQLIFDAACGTPMGYRFLVREQPYSTERDTGLYTVVHDGLIDMRFSGRHVRMRMEALVDEPFAVGRPRLAIRQGGRR